MSAVPVRRLFGGDADARSVASVIAAGPWTTELGPVVTVRRTFLDTHDGRVTGDGGVLEADETGGRRQLVWRDRHPARRRGEIALPSEPANLPRFAWELPEAALTKELTGLIDVRALLPFASVRTRRQVIGVRNGDDKLVARVVVDQDVLVAAEGRQRRRPLGRSVDVVALRGYGREADRIARRLADHEGLGAAGSDLLAAVVGELARPPGTSSSKLRLALDPMATASGAADVILRALLDTIDSNHQGTLDDLDSEFLHDLRVAVRRTRSGLKAFPGVFQPGRLARFAPGFRWVQQATGPARDLDVWLLEFEAEVGHLAPDVAAELEPLRQLVTGRRLEAHRRLNRALRSARYRRLLDRWRTFLDDPASGPEAGRPVTEVASERIWRAYRRVVKPGRAISDASPAEALHDLRKRGKELRYLLEFFSSLYRRVDVAPLVGELKALQDNLGSFQDDQVQAANLRSFADALVAAGTPPATLVALGQLVAHHERTSDAARAEFNQRFAAFDDPVNRRRFEALFG